MAARRRCTAREHVGPIELRIRDARRAQQQCGACGRAVGRAIPLEEFASDSRRKLRFWDRKRPSRPGTARRRGYHAFLRSPEWRAQRLRILERDGYRCQGEDCGAPATTVHHKSYRPVLSEVPDSELAASCSRCNLAERELRIGRGREEQRRDTNQGGNHAEKAVPQR